MKLTLEKQIPLVFSVAVLLLLVIAFFSYRSVVSLNDSLGWEKHTQAVIQQLDETLITAIDAETGGRGYVISGNENFLAPYNRAAAEFDEDLATLKARVADNKTQTERLENLNLVLGEKVEFMRKTVELRRAGKVDESNDLIGTGEGKRLMDIVRTIIGEMKTEEQSLLTKREADLNNSLRTTYSLILTTGIAGILLLGLANLAIFREVGKRRCAEDDLREANSNLERRVKDRTQELSAKNEELKNSEEFTRSIFENSPDCVKVLELDGTLHSMNNNGLCIMEIDNFDEFIGKQWVDFWEDEENELAYQAVQSAANGKNANFQGFCRTAKGTGKWWDVSVAPVFDSEGKPVRIISTSRDITERREAERQLEKLLKSEQSARKEAEIANRLRDEFLATVSHELRAPLTSILGWGRLLEKGNLDETTSAKAIQTIVRNADSQNRLIEDLLDVSRIISGKLRLEVVTIKPIIFVESALEAVRPAAEAKNIALKIKEDSVVSHISGDPNRLQQVVWNLLSNAIKFTPIGGEVTVEIERMNGHIDIRVKDTGVGISKEFLPHVFDRFRQADASSIRKFGGLGLGLAIVRHIAEMHGGTVFADSQGENQGSTFTVRLPVTSAPKEEEESENKPVVKNKPVESSQNLSLDGLLILVVDDEEDTRQMLVQSLTFYGATVITAKSAEEGLAELQSKNPDVMVSDIGMPDEDGYSLIRKIRALDDEQQKNTIAVALTAFTRAQDRMRALSTGFQNHVGKPVEPDELATVIASLTGRLRIEEN